ncbi:MAG TPA: ABC transporter permease [Gemmatimonadales bacterium]|nr:ABC transporter permease [Gemmatimonadales bacterium]
MHLLEAIRLAFRQLLAQKLKSGFALIGVFIGVTFLIGAWSIVNGINQYMVDKFAGTIIGVNTFHLRRRPDFTPNVDDSTWRDWARRPRITFGDAEAVAAGITVPVVTAWQSSSNVTIEANGKQVRDAEVTGATERYFEIKNLTIEQGRAFSAQEARRGVPVVVIGSEVAEKLFAGRDPIGKTLRMRGEPYRVIGVVAKQGKLFGFSLDRFAVAPARSGVQDLVNPPGIVDALIVKASSVEQMRNAMDQAEGIMRSRRHLRPAQSDNFVLETSDGVLKFWAGIQRILFVIGPGLVTISLVVGGIVIMNIMLMAVAERTREIGIRKSLGARRADILRQFLAESAMIATLGGALGIATGIMLSILLNVATPLPATVSPFSILLGVVLGGGVGVLAGVYPASRAARLDPIVALRQE